MSTLSVLDEPLFQSISGAARLYRRAFFSKELANMAWSAAARKGITIPLSASISAQAIPTCKDFGSQELANSAWAFAVLICEHNPLRASLAASAIRMRSEADCRCDLFEQHIANMAWA